MPGMDGFEAARRLTDCHPESVVVLVSLRDSEECEPLLPFCGAAAFLRKQDLAPRVLRRLWTIHGGGAASEPREAVTTQQGCAHRPRRHGASWSSTPPRWYIADSADLPSNVAITLGRRSR